MASLGLPGASSARGADLDAEVRDFVADLASWSSASNREDALASAEPAAFVPRDANAGAPIRGAQRATVTATATATAPETLDARRAEKDASSSSSSALREGMPTLADLSAAGNNPGLDGGLGSVFAEAAKHAASESETEDLSARGASRADREKLLAGLRDAPARERRWAAAREKEKGNELFKAREYRSAIEAYDVSIALDATSPAPFTNRAAAYMKLRRWSDATRDCDAALALDPENFKALLRRGACALEAGEEAAAQTALRDFEACAALEARRHEETGNASVSGEPMRSDAELVRLTAKARKALRETREKAARAAMRRVAIEEDDGGSSSADAAKRGSSSGGSVAASPVAPARRGPMVIEEIVEDPEPAAANERGGEKTKIVIQEASDSDDDAASPPTDVAARVAALKDEGNARFARGEYGSAIASYDEAIRALTDASETWADARGAAVLYANRAASRLKLGDFSRAERDANDAVARDATYVKAFHRRAAARAGLHQFEGALEDYEKVVRAAPESDALRREVNACMEKAAEAMLGGFAAEAKAKAVAIEPDSDDDSDDDDDADEAQNSAGTIAREPPSSAAETKAPAANDSGMPANPRTARAGKVAIVEEDSSDDEEDARAEVQPAAVARASDEPREPNEPRAVRDATTNDSREDASPPSDAAAFASESSATAHKDRGNALFRAGDYAAAEAAYSAAVAADPRAAAFYANRAAARLKLGAHDAALRDADAALALDPAHARARHRRAAALAKLGPARAAEAAEEYARVAATHPGHAGVAAEAAEAAEAASRAADAPVAATTPKADAKAADRKEVLSAEESARRLEKKVTPLAAPRARARVPPRAPRTATELERGCASLRGDPDALLTFLASIDDAALPGVLKHSVSATILRAYCVAFERAVGAPGFSGKDAAQEKTFLAATLAALATTPRFALAAAALGAADKRAIARVFDALGEACAKETRDAWR